VCILERFKKHLNLIEYPDKNASWDVAGVLKNGYYKFDVKGLKKTSDSTACKEGSLSTKADKMVFEFHTKWVILDIEELHEYIKKHKLKDINLEDLISRLEWNMIIDK
jgi:tetrahydromethanopterin S-methyltransferase subunit B